MQIKKWCSELQACWKILPVTAQCLSVAFNSAVCLLSECVVYCIILYNIPVFTEYNRTTS